MSTVKKIMRIIKYLMMALALTAVVLCLVYNVVLFGVHGVMVLVLSVVPLALGGMSVKLGGMPRWASAVNLASFLVVGMKTSGESTSLQNIMVAAFFGAVLSLILLIVTDEPRKGEPPKQ